MIIQSGIKKINTQENAIIMKSILYTGSYQTKSGQRAFPINKLEPSESNRKHKARAVQVINIGYIAGRILTETDIGQYIVRTRPSTIMGNHGQEERDYSWVPYQGNDSYTTLQLIGFAAEGRLLVKNEYGINKESCYTNDMVWITVEELKQDLKISGKKLIQRDGDYASFVW